MKEKTKISNLHQKFAEKAWKETFQLVRRCMEKPRDESKPCEPLVRSLERLQKVLHAPSMNATRSRLELIAKQQGMGFHIAESSCFLTADLFYLEVILLPCGGVQEVKVAPHGGVPVPSESLLNLLRFKRFSDFSVKLGRLFDQYNIPGDNEIKLKLLASLQYLEKDLQKISDLPREPTCSDPQMDLINNGRIGCLIAGKEDYPLTVQFYVPPNDEIKTSDSDLDPSIQAAQVTVGVSDVSHKLQTASVMSQPPQLDPQGFLIVTPLSEMPNEMLPALFLLKLQPAMPMISSFVEKLKQITDVAVSDVDLQWAPLPKLLMTGSASANSCLETLNEQNSFMVPAPGSVMHSCVLPGAAWDVPAWRAAVVDGVPFTHPAHVPGVLELLRHQCNINTLLRSCFSVQRASPGGEDVHITKQGSNCDLHFEVLPESGTSFSVTFAHPLADSLAVLLVDVSNPHQIACSLFGAGTPDPSLDECISTVLKSCLSIPATMKTLYIKLEEVTSAPLSPSRPATTEAQNDNSAPSSASAAASDEEPAPFSQSAAVPEDVVAVTASAHSPMSVAEPESIPEINSSSPVNPYPFVPAGVSHHWMGSNGKPSELI
ncbi:mediator of RNA polymerase II transcription subunit 1-like [Cololabis saira]|uniref:mediator of RNA polymerase II transcription subunit 1-like n=1 Tax=Cololabis saira TaxID=129043 RepID=UPI002AD47E85|nr:mediator of RNA polymerase II transcription subunit 1-like [Cololabis saira]